MKTIVRYLLAAAILAAIGLYSGCATPNKGKLGRLPAMSFQMKVVESSSSRQLTQDEMKILHDATIRFLAKQGDALSGGTFYVRVSFDPIKPGEPRDWVLVQIISQPIDASTRVAAYRDSSPYYYSGYASFGSSSYYPDYYYDPSDYFYGGRSYLPPRVTPPAGHRPDDRDRGDRPRDRDRGDRPPGTSPRGDGRDGDRDRDHRPRTGDYTPRSDDSRRGRGHDSDNSGPTTARVSDNSNNNSGNNSGGGGSYSPPPAPSYSPPPEPVRSKSSNSGIQKDSAQKEEN